ncbi:MAG TPA: prepilin-type N-terminal cleavage/methylation domain-containing protein [Gammaproteobacteria bacterium]|nr:prepilin-type N-terminal cleavage/methylation domain-containing protein [Gammaproteobacteria bacterium]
MNSIPAYTRRNGLSGFTLIEIMISMVLSLILLGGVLQIYSSTRTSYRVQDSVSQMQEAGRFTIETMSRDIRMADFWGCANGIGKVINGLDPAGGAGYIPFNNGGLAGTEGAAGAPDTLVLRGGFGASLGVEAPFGPQSSANVKIAVNNGFAVGDILMVSDCTAADIFQITSGNPDGTGTLVHNTGVSGVTPGNLSPVVCTGATDAHCLSKVYDKNASVIKPQQVTYSVGLGASGEPALLRNGQELIDGVEDLQILYGEDTDASGAANRYVNAGDVGNMGAVVSIRIALVTRSAQINVTNAGQAYSVMGVNKVSADTRLRQVYTATVGIRNRLP